MPIQTATISRLSPPVTSTLCSSSTVSTTPTVALIRRSTSAAGASTRIRACTAQPVEATSRSTNDA